MHEKRTLTRDATEKIGQEVTIYGWVQARRDHGKIIFLDIRDRWGSIQVVFVPGNDAYKTAEKVRDEFVVKVEGTVNKRPDKMVNEKIPTGQIEIFGRNLEIISAAETPPFAVADTSEISEETRLKYRYLDLRSERMRKNLEKRFEVINFARNWLTQKKFIEIETPIMTKSTPEGARDYIVPSRLQRGHFYALPQAPQQYKQLLMVAGIERYFQIARCFRDEDLRGDRQPEFTQMDIEMSFVETKDIMDLLENLMIELVKKVYPEKKLPSGHFPVMTYAESMEKYHSDKPDLRKNKNDNDELAFVWIVDFPLFEYNDSKELTSLHHPFTSFYKEDAAMLTKDPTKIRSHAFDLVLNGVELGSGSIRIHEREMQKKIFEILGLKEEEIEERFGHLLRAFDFGVPPHGGMAWGLDRIIMILQEEESVREVIAFPKNQEGRDLLMEAPATVSEKQLKEVHIKLDK